MAEPDMPTNPVKGVPSTYKYMSPNSPQFEKAFFAAHKPITQLTYNLMLRSVLFLSPTATDKIA
jgi:hypothetical protein